MTVIGREVLESPPAVIVNENSAGGGTPLNASTLAHGEAVSCGTIVADTYQDALSVTGRGEVDFIAVQNLTTLSKTLGLRIVIDGVECFEAVSAATTTDNAIMIGIGSSPLAAAYSSGPTGKRVFLSSLLVQIKSSDDTADNIGLRYAYDTKG